MDKITEALTKKFKTNRIVFWYDVNQDMREEFESCQLPAVEKIELENNEFSVKYRLQEQEPDQNFLLYFEGPRPENHENWLLDVLLAEGEFRADRISIWLSELGLSTHYWQLVEEHSDFFNAASRLAELKRMLEGEESQADVRRKMLAVCADAASDPQIETIILRLLEEAAAERDERYRLSKRSGLEPFLLEQLDRRYGYQSDTPGILDFAIDAFDSAYKISLGESGPLTQDAVVLLKRWKDSQRFRESFEILSERSAEILNIDQDLMKRDLAVLEEIDFFEVVDRRILSELAHQVTEQTISAADCANYVWRRRTTHWYPNYADVYEAIYQASKFLSDLNRAEIKVDSVSDGVQKYIQSWHELDTSYRKFIQHLRASKQVTLLELLVEKVENFYSTNFLLRLNDLWQDRLDVVDRWGFEGIKPQVSFFEQRVAEFHRDEVTIAVLISDGLRYEIGQELLANIRQEDRYEATIEARLGVLPSYTQLGMAALLPHESLEIEEEGSVLIDRRSATGTANRSKILNDAIPEQAAAVLAEDLMNLNREQTRSLISDHQVLYIYHNQIDAVGDKRDTEERTSDAVEQTLAECVDIMKKLFNANLSHLLITTDHGFIYQHRPLDESEFASVSAEGDEVWYRDRRFAVGRGLTPSKSIMVRSAEQLGLAGDYQVAFPKSINRFRQRGAGSRYVHGGTSLQEVILPVLHVSKKRESDVSKVELDIIRSSSTMITSGQLAVALYQVDPVSDKVQGRELRAGLFSTTGELISDSHELVFDLANEDAQEREIKVQFILTKAANQYNNQEVLLKLEEPVPGTSHYQEYKSRRYTLRRSFTSDFDL